MPYGIPDNIWAAMPLDAQWNAQSAVERARSSGGDVAAVKAQNFAYASQGSYTPEVPGMATGAPISYAPQGDQSGGGYGDGGGQPTRQLASSPEWLAYLNSLGLEQNQFQADIDRQRALAQSQADQSIQQLGPQFDQQRRGIAGSMSARGIPSSGETLQRLAESRASQGRATSGVQSQLASQLSGLESALAQKLIDINSRKAQEQLTLASQGYV